MRDVQRLADLPHRQTLTGEFDRRGPPLIGSFPLRPSSLIPQCLRPLNMRASTGGELQFDGEIDVLRLDARHHRDKVTDHRLSFAADVLLAIYRPVRGGTEARTI
jgi:hypothetical protein